VSKNWRNTKNGRQNKGFDRRLRLFRKFIIFLHNLLCNLISSTVWSYIHWQSWFSAIYHQFIICSCMYGQVWRHKTCISYTKHVMNAYVTHESWNQYRLLYIIALCNWRTLRSLWGTNCIYVCTYMECCCLIWPPTLVTFCGLAYRIHRSWVRGKLPARFGVVASDGHLYGTTK
jgi:hypothetical protein